MVAVDVGARIDTSQCYTDAGVAVPNPQAMTKELRDAIIDAAGPR